MKKTTTFSDEIRAALDASGQSRYRLARSMGVAESTLSRFMHGAGLSMAYLDRLAELLDLHVTTGKPTNRKG